MVDVVISPRNSAARPSSSSYREKRDAQKLAKLPHNDPTVRMQQLKSSLEELGINNSQHTPQFKVKEDGPQSPEMKVEVDVIKSHYVEGGHAAPTK